ncbi:slipin family protein [Sphingobacterium sp. WM]|uniref:slipin family protein n=1 Tax=Sphingobacterium sp. WM TaxID=3031802 RepID=UPI00240D2288|nr:slipin family protein [Sphingobacterium sp. WM]WFB64752.1 slipin family protein [Sphingobacterium sp. WM]
MKRIVINRNQIGFIIKNNGVKRIVTEGKYWLSFAEKVEIYDMSLPFNVNHNLDVLLTIPEFDEIVEIVEVLDNEIALIFVNNNFSRVLPAGRHVFWKGLADYHFQIESMDSLEVQDSINKSYLMLDVFKPYVSRVKVAEYMSSLLFVNGKFERELLPGEYFFWKYRNELEVLYVDQRVLYMDIPGQEILTKDKVQIRLNVSFQYKVVDVKKALLENQQYDSQLYLLMQMMARTFVADQTLDSLLENKDSIAKTILEEGKKAAEKLGVQLLSMGIKDIILPGEVKEIMSQVLIAEKKAQANTITRREETASTRSLLNTAKLLEENAMLFRLKEMEYVEKIAEKINSISVSGNGQVVDQLKQLFLNK